MYILNENNYTQNENPNTIKGKKAINYEEIGTTVYDLQTNYSVDHRCYLYPDGTIGTTFNFGNNPNNYPDHGTGYNYLMVLPGELNQPPGLNQFILAGLHTATLEQPEKLLLRIMALS